MANAREAFFPTFMKCIYSKFANDRTPICNKKNQYFIDDRGFASDFSSSSTLKE